jgi:hypothetical protein
MISSQAGRVIIDSCRTVLLVLAFTQLVVSSLPWDLDRGICIGVAGSQYEVPWHRLCAVGLDRAAPDYERRLDSCADKTFFWTQDEVEAVNGRGGRKHSSLRACFTLVNFFS